jgi:NAD(P)H-hydrate epimerase
VKELEKLLAAGNKNAGALARALGVSPPTIWRWIAGLRRQGKRVVARRTRSGWSYSIGGPAPSPAAPRGLPCFDRRPPDSQKYDFGRALIVAGSIGMAGAAILAGRAALRTGAGLVVMVSDAGIYPILAAGVIEAVHRPMGPPTPRKILNIRCDALAIGPGLGIRRPLVEGILKELRGPAVVDADGINALAGNPRVLRARTAPTLLTPHEGEFSRLLSLPLSSIQKGRETVARNAARDLRSILILKGHRTIVTDGDRLYVNPTGNPGMATAGSGDVLTGILVALLAQGFPPLDAARLGVWLHGRAGDLAALEVGEGSMIASDIIDALPRAIRERRR